MLLLKCTQVAYVLQLLLERGGVSRRNFVAPLLIVAVVQTVPALRVAVISAPSMLRTGEGSGRARLLVILGARDSSVTSVPGTFLTGEDSLSTAPGTLGTGSSKKAGTG